MDYTKPLAYQRHIYSRLSANVRQRAREEAPVRLSPVLQRTVSFPFFIGELGVHLVIRPYLYLRRLDDAQRISISVEDDGLQTDARQRLPSASYAQSAEQVAVLVPDAIKAPSSSAIRGESPHPSATYCSLRVGDAGSVSRYLCQNVSIRSFCTLFSKTGRLDYAFPNRWVALVLNAV